MESFEVFDCPIPNDESLTSKITEGSEVEYWHVLGRFKIVRIKN